MKTTSVRFSLLLMLFSLLFVSCGLFNKKKEESSNQSTAPVLDPLYKYQWHLNNTGQSTFASTAGVSGVDLNLQATWANEIKGKGVKVAVVDSGLEIAHEDLKSNVDPNGSWDFVDNDTDPTNPTTTGDHGTSVSGLIAAEEKNEFGGRGVAPSASVVGYNFMETQGLTDQLAALGASSNNPNSSDVSIFNQSYGLENTDDMPINSIAELQYIQGVTRLREGKGAIYIKAAGNGFKSFGNASCDAAQSVGLSCQNSNMDPENSIPWQIVVGSLAADGKRASYSTAGSSLWMTAPGGESGADSSRATANFPEAYEPAMLTVDQSGCSVGYAQNSSFYNLFEDNSNGLNPSCNYTAMFNGTSSATPVLSGAVALLLEANPSLTWRDVKYVLASTAKQMDADISEVTLTVGGSTYQAEQTWVTNAAGFKFHNSYGFGAVDVDAAVSKATSSYTNLSDQLVCDYRSSGTLTTTIPDNSVTGASNTLSISDNLTLESVQIKVSLTHSYLGDLSIELHSPSGSKSFLLTALNAFGSSKNLNSMVLLSNAFYGEKSVGNWTLKVVDTSALGTGTLTQWEIKVIGREGTCASTTSAKRL